MSEYNRRPDVAREEPESGTGLSSTPEQRPAGTDAVSDTDIMSDQARGFASDARSTADEYARMAREQSSGAGPSLGQSPDSMKDQARDLAEDARGKAAEIGDKAREQAEAGKDQAAGGMEKAADMMRERVADADGGVASQAGTKVADGMDTAAGYLKGHDTTEMWNDVETFAKAHPAQALAGAVVAGFLLGRLIR